MQNPFKPITEQVADGVWRHAGDLRQAMNIYLLAEDDGSVTIFDGGTAGMTEGVRRAAEEIGPIKRIVLGHGHADHRGVAPRSASRCSATSTSAPTSRATAGCTTSRWTGSASGSRARSTRGCSTTGTAARRRSPRRSSEGDEVAGFTVKHFPGHAPGLIGLWRERDRLAIVCDTVYFVDSMKFKPVDWPNVPNRVFNQDHDAAIASLRKLAALEPRVRGRRPQRADARRAQAAADAPRPGCGPRLTWPATALRSI